MQHLETTLIKAVKMDCNNKVKCLKAYLKTFHREDMNSRVTRLTYT